MTILNQTPVMVQSFPDWVFAAGFILEVILILVVLFFLDRHLKLTIAFLIVVVLIGVFELFGGLSEKETPRMRYECTIDNTVSFTEIYEKYDVIEKRGEIWVLEDKEKE